MHIYLGNTKLCMCVLNVSQTFSGLFQLTRLIKVQYYLGQCSCPTMFSLRKVGDGKYQIGDSKALIYMRVSKSDILNQSRNRTLFDLNKSFKNFRTYDVINPRYYVITLWFALVAVGIRLKTT